MNILSRYTRIITTTLLVTLSALTASAQASSADVAQLYSKAQTEYNNGQFDKCKESLYDMLPSAKGMLKTSAYRLLALCSLEQGNIEEAKNNVTLLLKSDPYFTPSLGDPMRFLDMVSEAKDQSAGITTASRQAETIEEAPVPVTLITDEMIRHSGAQTLQEVLCLFVPGMTVAEGMESNIAMHGVYSLAQDKILIMVDGHRLNSSSTNAEAPDFRTSLDKVKQIEVLRGPASSLYGNVALTAVVNIITYKGAELNGARISGTAGSQHSFGGSMVVGGGNNVVDIMGWGSIYNTQGFVHEVNNEYGGKTKLYSHATSGKPCYDIGIKGRWQDFTIGINMQRSKRMPYINVLQVNSKSTMKELIIGSLSRFSPQITEIIKSYGIEPNSEADVNAFRNFNYDRYGKQNGETPGIVRSNNRINIDYAHTFGKVDVQASAYINFESTSLYNVLGDSINSEPVSSATTYMMADILAKSFGGSPIETAALTTIFDQYVLDKSVGDVLMKVITPLGNDIQSIQLRNVLQQVPTSHQGVFQKLDWQNTTYGFQAQGLTNYNLLGRGTVILGAQFEQFNLTGTNFNMGGGYNTPASMSSSVVFRDGNETSLSGYVQVKHFFSPRWILNAGLRYDNKRRFNGSRLKRLSPRFSIIHKLNDHWTLRGNYNYSFVDAPYLYRVCILPIFSGGEDMQPETMHGINLGTEYHKGPFSAEVGTFYNLLNDLVVLNTSIVNSILEGDSEETYIFKNAGKVHLFGVEGAAQYHRRNFFANLNATWQRVVKHENYIVHNSQTFSTPAFHTNLTVAGAPYRGRGDGFFKGGTLWLRGTGQFQTATYSRTVDLLRTVIMGDYASVFNRVAPQFVLGVGANYEWKYLDVSLSLKNIFNNKYHIGSMLADGIPRPGRAFVAKLTVKF